MVLAPAPGYPQARPDPRSGSPARPRGRPSCPGWPDRRRRLRSSSRTGRRQRRRFPVHVDRHALAMADDQRPQVVDAVALVGVLMGQQDGVQPVDPGGQQLVAHVGRGIDQDHGRLERSRRPGADQDRAPRPAVPRLGRIPDAPVVADARNAAGRSAPQNADLQPCPLARRGSCRPPEQRDGVSGRQPGSLLETAGRDARRRRGKRPPGSRLVAAAHDKAPAQGTDSRSRG